MVYFKTRRHAGKLPMPWPDAKKRKEKDQVPASYRILIIEQKWPTRHTAHVIPSPVATTLVHGALVSFLGFYELHS